MELSKQIIPKSAIELAIAGGWVHARDGIAVEFASWDFWQCTALDPTFWQALGKSCGWSDSVEWWSFENVPLAGSDDPDHYEDKHYSSRALWNAHRFYDLILTEQSTDDFWHNLLPTKE